MTTPLVSILVPNYRTLVLTKICLRLLRQFTDLNKVKVIVIDNDSQDESLAYLKTLPWITLLERPSVAGEATYEAHSRALDLALEQVTTPYVLSVHTDSFVKQANWLEFLLQHIDQDPLCAGVGSWKLEQKSWLKRALKRVESLWQSLRLKAKTTQGQSSEKSAGHEHYYLRSHCALYRTDLLKQHGLSFGMEGETPGKAMHRRLVELGFSMKFLSSEELLPYMDHINHATMILNPSLGARAKTVSQGLKKISRQLNSIDLKRVLAADHLDR